MTEQETQLPTPAQTNQNGQAPAPQRTGTTIEPGVYEMRATDAELGYTGGSDGSPPAPQVAVLFEFVDGKHKGLTITWYGFFTEKTKATTIRSLRTIGWQGDDLGDLSTARGTAPCTVQVEPDLQGVMQARIRWVGGGSIAMKTVMSDDQKRAFAESMKGFASTIGAPEKKEEPKPASGKTGQKFF